MSYTNKCRTCLGSGKETRDVHTSVLIAGDDVRLSYILESFYKYSVTDDKSLPQNICINCVHQLTITYSFKILIESSHRTLTGVSELLDTGIDYDDNDTTYEPEDNNKLNKPNVNDYHYQVPILEPEPEKQPARTPVRLKKLAIKIRKNAKKTLYCIECKRKFGTVGALHEHYNSTHPRKSNVGRECEYCSERFEDFRSLILHKKRHLRPLVCDKCWQGFYHEHEMSDHSCKPKLTKKEKMKLDRVLRQCDQCGKAYPPGYIKIHMRTHSEDRPYQCKFCPKQFKVLGGLHSHIQWNHKRTRNHRCEVCNATFITSSARSTHIRKHHLKEKKYACKCGKKFFSKSELERHNLTHTGVKNFHCHLCDKSYQTRYGLNVHLKSHSQMNVMTL